MSATKFDTLVDIFTESSKRYPQRELFGEKKDGLWRWMTYGTFKERVDALRGGLAALGLGPGDRVAVISNNRAEWAIGAYATYSLGGAYVPMYEAQHDGEWAYILRDCGAAAVLVATDAIARRVEGLQGALPDLRHVVRFPGTETEPGTLASLLRRGVERPAPAFKPARGDLAGLIYTSGTTGNPKGVRLSHHNLAANVSAMHEILPLSPDDRSLSFLPWAHSFGQGVELHALYSMGASLGIAEGVDKLLANMAEIQPTVLMSVPRVFNKLYDGLQKKLETMPAVRRRLLETALDNAAARRALRDEGRHSAAREIAHAGFDRAVLSKVRHAFFGRRLRYAFSGGAAISREVAAFIDNLGVTVYEGYGLTETSPIATANCPGARKLGSVGRAIPGTRVVIDRSAADDPRAGEVVVYGHNVMQGYHGLPAEDAKVFTPDGGLRTGDLGYLDEDGFLFITGRIKEQYKLENGKYVVPVPLEEAIKLSKFVANAMVHGANRPFNVAVVVPDLEYLKKWAVERGVAPEPVHALLARPEVTALYRGEIEAHTRDARGYEKVRDFVLAAEDFTLANDMLTPSMKLKRRTVLARYGETLEALYRASAASASDAAR